MFVQIGLIFLAIVLLMILGIPVGIAFGAGALVMLFAGEVDPVWAIAQSLHLLSSYNFLVLPLYILLGSIIGISGMAQKLADFAIALVGRLRGGLGVSVIIANGVFGAMSGSALSALGGMGKSFLEPLERQGYPKSYALALLIPSAVLSTLIPPSGFMIIFGFLGRLSIAKCFLAGMIPGLVLMVFLSITHLVMCQRIKGIFVPPVMGLRHQFTQIAKVTRRGILTLIIPVVVLGSIYGGIASVAESAAIGAAYALVISVFVYRTIKLQQMGSILITASRLVGSILILFFFFIVLNQVLVIEQVSEKLLAIMMTISTNRYVIMSMMNLLMLLMGMMLDDHATVVIAVIILLPIAVDLGYDPYHFAAVACINLELGLITPPVAPLLYLGGHIAGDMPLGQYVKPVLWFLLCAFLPTMLLTIFIPELSTYLPGLFSRSG
ncbi:TRAP transporter large permease [Chloroflexota bacterium]